MAILPICYGDQMDVTRVWTSEANGAFAVLGAHGAFVGVRAVSALPEWAAGDPDMTFAPEIEWNGGARPVPAGQVVLCRMRGGGYYLGPSDPHSALWLHAPAQGRPNPAGDIVSYQVAI
jgi:hypothetical protein